MKKNFKLVCFDMDGTLIRNTNSVDYLCWLCNKASEVAEVVKQEESGVLTWIEADYIKAKYITGLKLDIVKQEFLRLVKVIMNLDLVLEQLRLNNIKCVLITAGPSQVADIMDDLYGFDAVFGSTYEVSDGHFTGSIIRHLGDTGKLECLEEYCRYNEFSLEEVVSVGDSLSDASVFKESGKSIAINYSDKLKGKADEYLFTEDLLDILKFII